jgi:very-short-patch-repair endonuclease
MAAVLACGEGALLSHRSAAELWELLPPRGGPIDITVPTAAGRRKRRGIRIHRSPSLPRNSATTRNRIAVTTAARTLTNLKRTVTPAVFRKAVRQAEFLGLQLDSIETDHTRSELERAFLRLCRQRRLPEPEVNIPIGPFTVDFLWREQRLIVEVDGWQSHRGSQAFEDDRARELKLELLGFRVRRFSHTQVTREQALVATAVRRALQA